VIIIKCLVVKGEKKKNTRAFNC